MTKTQLDIEDGRTGERKLVTESQLVSSCPECDGQVIRDDEHGETTCEECGLVLDEESIDRGPDSD